MIETVVDECHGWVSKTVFQFNQGRVWPQAKGFPFSNWFVEVVGLTTNTIVTAKMFEPPENAMHTNITHSEKYVCVTIIMLPFQCQ